MSDAYIDIEVPSDIYTAAEQEIGPLEDTGVSYSQLTSQQQLILIDLIEELTSTPPDAISLPTT